MERRLHALRLRVLRWRWALPPDADLSNGPHNPLLLIDPAVVEFTPAIEFSSSWYQGAVVYGDWDLSRKRFDRLDVYHAFDRVCRQRTLRWQETPFYWATLKQIESGNPLWKCRDRADLDTRCESLSALWASIERDGYQTQAELGTGRNDEVAVAIGRDGEMLFSDGAHRLAIAKLLGVSQIPVIVAVRHPEWLAFKNRSMHLAGAETPGASPQPCPHPDLVPVPAEPPGE